MYQLFSTPVAQIFDIGDDETATEDCRLKEARIAVIIECRVRSLVIWFVVHPFVITIAIIANRRKSPQCALFWVSIEETVEAVSWDRRSS
jgi:hypothetical protein